MEHYAIIVAGGSGSRMQNSLPKQFISINGKPILMHTISAFNKYNSNINLILVLPIQYHELWKKLCIEYHFDIKHTLVEGGNERFFSVKNGLKNVPDNAIVAIHDGVRPFVSSEIIQNTFETATQKGNAIPAISLSDSVRKIEAQNNYIINRDELRLIQTPQVFKSEIIKKAYKQNFETKFTDDASVVENLGEHIYLVQGDRKNIKITWQEDLLFAEYFLTKLKI